MDPIHGYISFTEIERKIIDTETFQRLHRLKQLGMAFVVYPGGIHTRFSHSIGAMHLAGLSAQKLIEDGILGEDAWQIARLGALLHDIGHGPFSHSSENTLKKKTGLTHEDMTSKLILETEIGDKLEEEGYDKNLMSKLAIGQADYKGSKVISKIIAGQVDVDKLDFLNRDAHFTGVPYGKVDHRRLIEGLQVYSNDLVINYNALYALEQFIIARYEMFKAVYYHRTVRAAETMFDKILGSFSDELGISDKISSQEYLGLDDGYVWSKLRQLCKTEFKEKEKKKSQQLFNMLQKRELLKSCYEILRHETDPSGRIMENEKVVFAIIESIATEAGVDVEDVFIDSPALPTIPLGTFGDKTFDVKIFDEKNKKLLSLAKISPIGEALTRYMEVIRVYTLPKHREAVSLAATKVFKREFLSEKVSY